MNCEQAYENLEAFVFGTLDDAEVKGVEQHLDSGCEKCHARLRELSALSVQLAGAVPQKEPPGQLKGKIMDAIRPPAADQGKLVGDQTPKTPWWVVLVPAAVMATAAVAAIGLATKRSNMLKDDIAELRGALKRSQAEVVELRSEMTAMQEAARLLGLPCTRMVDLAGVDPNPDAAGRFVVHPDEPVGVLMVYKMPQAPDGMQYQLWTMRDGKPHSVGLFKVENDGTAVIRTGQLDDPRGISEFKVTIEPVGGRPQPEGMLYLTGVNTLDTMH